MTKYRKFHSDCVVRSFVTLRLNMNKYRMLNVVTITKHHEVSSNTSHLV